MRRLFGTSPEVALIAEAEAERLGLRSWGGFVMAAKKIDYDVTGVELGNVVALDEIEERPLAWLWRGYIPRGKITILDGDPGLGKSTLLLDLVARRSSGRELPHEPPPAPLAESCLIISGEDDIADTIVPRLRAAGANLSRTKALALRKDKEGRTIPFSVPEDMSRLENGLGESEATFVVIDPITAFLSERIQSHNDASVRKAMTPLAEVAQKSGAALVLVRHLNKDTSVTKALYRGGGSIGFSGSARSVLIAAERPEGNGVMVLAQTKSNLARRGQARSMEWRVVPWEDDPEIARIKWLGQSELTADDLLRRRDARTDDYAQREAVAFLQTALRDGPRESKAVLGEAHQLGISPTTLKRARGKAGVHAYRARRKDGSTKAWFLHLRNEPCPPDCRGGGR